jgi:hypothetical protein
MSDNNVESGNKSKPKVTVKEEPTSPSGSACICKSDKRDVSCLLHGG